MLDRPSLKICAEWFHEIDQNGWHQLDVHSLIALQLDYLQLLDDLAAVLVPCLHLVWHFDSSWFPCAPVHYQEGTDRCFPAKQVKALVLLDFSVAAFSCHPLPIWLSDVAAHLLNY